MMAETTSSTEKEMLDVTQEDDPGDFLLSNTRYHDCHLTVGDPEDDDVETIGVSSTQLIAHSSVFRGMLANSKLADPSGTKTHIIDVSPATFKLMLRYVYGAKLPKMSSEQAAHLALCADKYNIQRLVEKAAKRIKPTSAADVFYALTCVAYINCPSLELQVSKIIQEQTRQVCQNPKFLDLDENSILFIVKQSVLNIKEVELWQNMVRWAESQVQKCPARTPRSFLDKVLHYVRLPTLSCEEVMKHVLPTKILTPEEFMDLTSAISLNQMISSPKICSFQEERLMYSDVKCENVAPVFTKNCLLKLPPPNVSLTVFGEARFSTLIINPLRNIEISSITLKGKACTTNNTNSFGSFEISCVIRMYKSEHGLLLKDEMTYEIIKSNERAVPLQDITLSLKKNNGQPLVLEKRYVYSLVFELAHAFVTHTMESVYNLKLDRTNVEYNCKSDFTYKFVDPFHVIAINYRV